MKLLAVALLVMVSATARAQDPPALDVAIKQAAAAGKPLVVETFATWCGPCKVFEGSVLPDARVQKALETVVFVRYDIDRSPGTEAAATLGSTAVPTFLALDASGTERARKQGGLNLDDFLAFLDSARFMTLDQPAIEARLKRQANDPQAHMDAARWFLEHGRNSEAIGQWQQIARDRAAPAGLRQVAAQKATRWQRIEDWRRDLTAEQVAQIRADLTAVDPGVIAAAVIGSTLSERESLDLLGQVITAQTSMDALNTLAYVALAAHANALALEAATKVVADSRTAQRLDTLAECQHVLGNTTAALALEDEALGLAQGGALEPQLRANRKRFETGTDPASETLGYEARAKELWSQVEHADVVPTTVITAAMRSQLTSMQRQYLTRHTFDDSFHGAERNIEAACRPQRGKTEAIVARFDVPTDGRVKTVVFLTDGSKALRACIERELAAWVLPTPPAGAGRQSLLIVFQ